MPIATDDTDSSPISVDGAGHAYEEIQFPPLGEFKVPNIPPAAY